MMNKELQFTCSLGRGRLLVRVYGEVTVTEVPSSSRKHIRYQVDINGWAYIPKTILGLGFIEWGKPPGNGIVEGRTRQSSSAFVD